MTVLLVIHIKDGNDQPPAFNSTFYSLSVTENVSLKYLIRKKDNQSQLTLVGIDIQLLINVQLPIRI